MSKEYIDIQVYDGDDKTKYIKYEDMINLIERIKIKQDEKDKEIERLNKELEIAKSNEETYRLEMLDITKRLGLKEDTMFDEVKDKAERLNNIIKELDKQNGELGAELSLTTDKYEKKLFIKENIIKEVREYIEERIKENENINYIEMTNNAYIIEQQELLEILDKGE